MRTDKYLYVAKLAALEAGAVVRRYFGNSVDKEEKTPRDYVTEADRESEKLIIGIIKSFFPQDTIFTEEGGFFQRGEIVWVIDPLDGTNNFINGLRFYSVSIAVCIDGKPYVGVVYLPEYQEMFYAIRGEGAYCNGTCLKIKENRLEDSFIATGFPFHVREEIDFYLTIFKEVFRKVRAIRRMGAATIDLAYTAKGVFDGFFEFGLFPWDVAAGSLLVEEAGGVVTDLRGEDSFLYSGNIVAGKYNIVKFLLDIIARYDKGSLDRIDRYVVDRSKKLRS